MKHLKILQLILRAISIFVVFIVMIKGLDYNLTPYSYLFIFLFNAYQIYSSRKHIFVLLIVIFISYCNYSIIYANFISPLGTAYTEGINQTVSNISLNIVLLFTSVMLWLTDWKSIPKLDNFIYIDSKQKNSSLIIITTLLLFFIFIFGFRRPESIGVRGTPRPIYEYSLIIFLMFFMYSGNIKKYTRFGLFMIVLFSLQNFVFGGRILGIQFLLCAYLILFVNSFSKKTIISLMIGGLIIMNIIGSMRGQLLYQHINFNAVLSDIINDGGALDTACAAYYTSESFVYTFDFLSSHERLFLFGKFISGIFLGSERQYIIQNITKEYVTHSNGGVFPLYFYLYLGPLGFLVSNILLAFYLKIVSGVTNNSSYLVRCLAVYVTCHTFRWYLYTPNGLLRGVIFLVVVYYSFVFANRILPKKL